MSEGSPEQVEREIEQTREQLGETVEALAAKTDVKAAAQRRLEGAKSKLPALAGVAVAGAVAGVVVLVRRRESARKRAARERTLRGRTAKARAELMTALRAGT
jgi:Protein of unknown function (DUF3618)